MARNIDVKECVPRGCVVVRHVVKQWTNENIQIDTHRIQIVLENLILKHPMGLASQNLKIFAVAALKQNQNVSVNRSKH